MDMESSSIELDCYASDEAAYERDLYSLPKLETVEHPLSLEVDYLPEWIFRDCFREVCQNWSDGMRESYDLGDRNFITEIDETKVRWLTRALHPDTRVLMGYIRFQKRKGMIELTNFNAQLSRRTLNLGSGGKHAQPHLAGGKGEGYKAAAVVALKNGYQFQYEASGCFWQFHVGQVYPKQIYCRLMPVKPKVLEKIVADYTAKFGDQRHPREMDSFIHKDVTVKIGNVYTSKSFPGLKVTEELFRECVKVSLDLVSPSTMITTPDGELILDEEFRDKTYLKRLLVEGNPGIFKYKFGYHFYEGLIDRDRRRMPNSKEDALRVAKIWRHAIKKSPEILDSYIDMIEGRTTEWADVYLAEDHVSKGTAEMIAQYYFDKDSLKNIFYYDGRSGSKDIEIIKRSLKKKPEYLAPNIWDILRGYKLVRTPQEEQQRLLRDAPEAQDNESPYSNSLKRALKASLRLFTRTKHIELSFRSGAKSDLDLVLCGSVLNINEKWLDFHTSHKQSPCILSQVPAYHIHDDNLFTCHHIVSRLHKLVLQELARHRDSNDDIDADLSLHHTVQEHLSKMPILIKANATEQPGEISVSWMDLDFVSRLHKLPSRYRVILHRESTCSRMRDELLATHQITGYHPLDVDPETGTAPCGCPKKIVSQLDSKALFPDLDATDEYFPMVAQTDEGSFFGVPPKAVRPHSQSLQMPIRSLPFTSGQVMADDTNNNRDQLGANPSGSMTPSTLGVKRNLNDEDRDDSGPARRRKGARGKGRGRGGKSR